jgi:alkylhydroperoxidase family enzyme
VSSDRASGAPAISLPEDAEIPPQIRKTLAALPPLNVFRMATRAPASFQALVDLALSILVRSEFDARKREIAVLRVAHQTRSEYAWEQHVTVGKLAGLTNDEIARIATPGPVTSLDDEGNLLCRVADEITKDVRLSDEALAAIVSRYGERQATELILCCSYFNMLSRFLESTRVRLESEPVLEKMP